ncbi:MAG: helix-turn-helix domain-containing protein [Candidatus Thorarchaeota archaeon]
MSDKKPAHEDFISDLPDTMKIIRKGEMQLMDEYPDIVKALSGKNMTVKEIHSLFWNPDKKKYDKTIKTVYRHLDALEKAGLVKVVGHRKPTNSRLTEKLYSRAAKVFFLEEKDRGPKWWETEEGAAQIDELAKVVGEYFDIEGNDTLEFHKLLKQYYEGWDSTVMDLFSKTQTNDTISDIFSKADINRIKSIAGFIGILGAFSKYPQLLESMRKVIEK